MIRNVLIVDIAIALLIGLLVLLLSPGLAVAAIIALVVLVACGVSLLWGAWRTRRSRRRAPRGGRLR